MKVTEKILAVFFFMAMLAPLSLNGQGGSASTMKFAEEEWNFGTVEEEKGPVSHVFEFTNTGDVAFVIEHITVSCGCTTPEFTRQPIKPGGRGEVTVTFNPANKNGVFNYAINVRSNGGRNENIIRIKGNVIPKKLSVEEEYPFATSSGLRFSTLSVNLMYVGQNEVRSMTVACVNPTDKEIALSFRNPSPKNYFKVSAPKTICAGCRGEVTVTYDMRSNAYGRFVDRIYPVINGKEEQYPLSATAIGVDPMKGVDEANAARASLEPLYHNLGDAKRGVPLRADFTLSNTGKKPLTVRWVGLRPMMSSTLKEGTVIQPGKSVEFQVGMDSSEADSGLLTGSVSFIVNDPVKPLREVRINANIQP